MPAAAPSSAPPQGLFGAAASRLRNVQMVKTVSKRVSSLIRGPGAHLLEVLDCCDGVLFASDAKQHFRIGRELGVGQTAVVYQGTRKSDGVKRALKIFKDEEMRGNLAALEALQAEVEILKALPHHKYVINLHEVISTAATSCSSCTCGWSCSKGASAESITYSEIPIAQ